MTSIIDPRPVSPTVPVVRRRWLVSALANANRAVIVPQNRQAAGFRQDR